MAVLRTDIERALDEIAWQEEGMRFQGLAVVLGKKRWPELIARQRKKDSGLDAYAPAGITPEKVGKGLAASITPTLKKVSSDAATAKRNFPDLRMLLFVTSEKVGNAERKEWEDEIQKKHGMELLLLEREEIITLLLMPENAALCGTFLHLEIKADPQLTDLFGKARRAAEAIMEGWTRRLKGQPLIELTALRLDSKGAETGDTLSLKGMVQGLLTGERLILEAPAGRGKTTTLIQLAQRAQPEAVAFILSLPAWILSRKTILEYLAGTPQCQAEGVAAADLAKVQQAQSMLFLLNGWNEVAASSADQAAEALADLDRSFPAAGIIVATRTHHLTPLPGAGRLRLMRVRRAQRAAYITARAGAKAPQLREIIETDASLDELTRSPFVLSEVTTLFDAGAQLPKTRFDVLAAVIQLQEGGEHKNALAGVPLYGRQSEYLRRIATEMTHRGEASLPEADALCLVADTTKDLVARAQIEQVTAPAVLTLLTARHLLERIEYPEPSLGFEHQQFQEYYAAIDIREQLFGLRGGDGEAVFQFMKSYVNQPAWEEPLLMIAETLAAPTGKWDEDEHSLAAGRQLVEMALALDAVFAGEVSRACGPRTWAAVRDAVGARMRSLYAAPVEGFQHYALSAMLATGFDDFQDIVAPLLSSPDQQTRLRTHRLWSDMNPSILGAHWRDRVAGWSEEARQDFVSEVLRNRLDPDVATFAASDRSAAVKKAAASSLMWTGSDDALTRLLESMDATTFEAVAREHIDRVPDGLRGKAVAALKHFVEKTQDQPVRLRAALDLIGLGETSLDGVLKDALRKLPNGDIRNLGLFYIEPALVHLRTTDPAWVSEWVAVLVAENVLYSPDYWMKFAMAVPDAVVEKYLHRFESEDLSRKHFGGMVDVVAAGATVAIARRLFEKIRALGRQIDQHPKLPHELERQLMRQLEEVFRAIPDDIQASGVLSSVHDADSVDIRVAAGLLSRAMRSDVRPLQLTREFKASLRDYLKRNINLVLAQDDFNGEEKANFASALAQVGELEDMTELRRLIEADIQRMRRGRAARAAGDHSALGNGGNMSFANWHIAAVLQLDPHGADWVLIDLLSEPDYAWMTAECLAREFEPKSDRAIDRMFSYELMWASREGRIRLPDDAERRPRIAAALNGEIRRLLDERARVAAIGHIDLTLGELVKALATVDPKGYTSTVFEVLALPSSSGDYRRVEAAERLLIGGVPLPTPVAFAILDSLLARTRQWMQDSDKYLLKHILVLCAFVDDPAKGIARIHEVLVKKQLWAYELRELVTALGESRSEAALDVLCELAADPQTFEHCEDNFINAFAALDTPRARDLLLGFIDPDIQANNLKLRSRPYRDDMLVARLAELAQRDQKVAARLRELCQHDLPESNRDILSRVMYWRGTPQDLAAILDLIDDAKRPPAPQGIWDQLHGEFIDQRPYGDNPKVFTRSPRASSEMRTRVFRMVTDDAKRRKTAYTLLGHIEEWRLDYGRPPAESRHPDIDSGRLWPPKEPA